MKLISRETERFLGRANKNLFRPVSRRLQRISAWFFLYSKLGTSEFKNFHAHLPSKFTESYSYTHKTLLGLFARSVKATRVILICLLHFPIFRYVSGVDVSPGKLKGALVLQLEPRLEELQLAVVALHGLHTLNSLADTDAGLGPERDTQFERIQILRSRRFQYFSLLTC